MDWKKWNLSRILFYLLNITISTLVYTCYKFYDKKNLLKENFQNSRNFH